MEFLCEEALVLASLKVAISLHTVDQHMAMNMVANNMSICMYVSDDQLRLGVFCRTNINIGKCCDLDNSLLEQMLYLLDDAMKKGMLDASARGKLVAPDFKNCTCIKCYLFIINACCGCDFSLFFGRTNQNGYSLQLYSSR